MIHPVGEIIHVPVSCIVQAIKAHPNNSAARQYGYAVDALVKADGKKRIPDFVEMPAFAAYDFECGVIHYEIKSTSERSFTFSDTERTHHRDRFRRGLEGVVLFYVNGLDACTTMFIGQLSTSYIFNEGLFQLSWINEDKNEYYIELAHVVHALNRQTS